MFTEEFKKSKADLTFVSYTLQFFCEKFPGEDSGFACSDLNLELEPAESVDLILSWTPVKEGNVRELIHWKTTLGVRAQTVILGTCVDPNAKKVCYSMNSSSKELENIVYYCRICVYA